MNEIAIRKLNRSDFDAFWALRSYALTTDPTSFWNTVEESTPGLEEKYEKRMQQENDFTLGAFVGEALVGMMAFTRYKLKKLVHKGDIEGVYVHPDHRGKGISSLLLAQTLEKAFAQEGLNKVTLAVTEGNVAAKSLYEKYGFIVYGHEENGMVVDGQAYGQYWMHIAKLDWQG